MRIVPLTAEHEPLFCACLEDWSEEIKEGGDHKARRLERMQARGLRVKLALDDRGEVGGMIQYFPVEDEVSMRAIWPLLRRRTPWSAPAW